MKMIFDQIDEYKWQVEGSKGNIYTISCVDEVYLCTCPAFQYHKGDCKHIKALIEHIEELNKTLDPAVPF